MDVPSPPADMPISDVGQRVERNRSDECGLAGVQSESSQAAGTNGP